MAAGFDCQDELIELFDDLVWVIFCLKAPDGTYLAVNRAFVRRTGRRSKRDVVGRRARDLFDEELAVRYEEQDLAVASTGRPLHNELELIRRADGRLGWYSTTKLPVTAPDGVGIASISRDLETARDDVEVQSLGRVVEHVRGHVGDTIRVSDLARIAGCSTDQLRRRFHRAFGLSPTQFVLRERVDRAADLLARTSLPTADVAVAAGFYDQADMTRQFTKLISETPGQFRSRQRHVD